MENDYFGLLYCGSDKKYFFPINHVPTADVEDALKINFIERYDNLSVEEVNKISKIVKDHRGSQKTLIEKIEGIFDK